MSYTVNIYAVICPKCGSNNPSENKIAGSVLWKCPCGHIWQPKKLVKVKTK